MASGRWRVVKSAMSCLNSEIAPLAKKNADVEHQKIEAPSVCVSQDICPAVEVSLR